MTFEENLLKFLSNDECTKLIDSFKNKDTHAILVNNKFISNEEILKLFPSLNTHQFIKNAYTFDKEDLPLGKSLFHELGYFYIQDPAAMMVASLIDFNEGDLVLDMCAAPGGKTIQSAFKLNGKGLIIANDISKQRAEIISNNVERLGIKNVIITNNDFSLIYRKYLNTFDKIILDAPCSGSGMFRKNDEMLNDWSINKVYKNAEIQKELIAIAYQMLKPGGLLSYSTCSYSLEEDEEVIEYLLTNTDAIIEPIENIGFVNKNKPLGIRLMPSQFYGEGQYICHIRKPGTIIPTKYKENKNNYKFLAECTKNQHIIKANDTYFALDYNINLDGLRIIRAGVKIGNYFKDILHYDLHFARSLNKDDFESIELSKDELSKYLEGNQINHISNKKGHVLLTYNNAPIDIAKTNGIIIKNNYPKGLRRKFH